MLIQYRHNSSQMLPATAIRVHKQIVQRNGKNGKKTPICINKLLNNIADLLPAYAEDAAAAEARKLENQSNHNWLATNKQTNTQRGICVAFMTLD